MSIYTPQRRPDGLLRGLFLGIAATLASAVTAGAATIVSFDGLATATHLGGVDISNGRAVHWLSTLPFEDVSITADLYAVPGRTGEATAYLTTRLGPGTTVADEVARATVALTAFDAADHTVALFSGLSLAAGEYFLVVTPGATNGLWEASAPNDFTGRFFPHPNPPNGTISVPGFPAFQFVALSSAPAPADPFGPARPFTPLNFAFGTMHFAVNGRLAQDPLPPSVPEPGMLALLLVGGLALARRRRPGARL